MPKVEEEFLLPPQSWKESFITHMATDPERWAEYLEHEAPKFFTDIWEGEVREAYVQTYRQELERLEEQEKLSMRKDQLGPTSSVQDVSNVDNRECSHD